MEEILKRQNEDKISNISGGTENGGEGKKHGDILKFRRE